MALVAYKDILLDSNHDIDIINFDVAWTTNSTITAQRIKQKLLTIQGEWFLNGDLGLPYFTEIFEKGTDLTRIEMLFIREIQSVEQVTEILKFNLTFNSTDRKLNIDLAVKDNFGNILEIEV